jgi:hypothetical protein
MNVARALLAAWERDSDIATDACVRADASHSRRNERAYRRALEIAAVRWECLIEWLDEADLRGSSFDPTTDLYLAVTVERA